jgi:choline dehydrogenase-like flavoprotein
MIHGGLDGVDAATPDTVIIGSGPAGLTLALELARLGRPSLVLESGVDRAGPAQDLSRAEIVDPARHDDMSIAVARRLGGASNLWGGRCMPLDPLDFTPRAFAQNVRWPIGFDDIAPYYEAACRYASCGEPAFTLPLPDVARANDDFAFDTVERASNRPRFSKAHGAALAASRLIDIRLDASVVDFALNENGGLDSVTAASASGETRVIRAKRFVIAAGGLESTRLLLALQRQHADLFGGEDGPLGRYYMGHVIGEIADVIFVDSGLDAAFDFIRDGRGSYVRRRFTPSDALSLEHALPNLCFWPVTPPVADPRHGSGALSAVALALSAPVLGRALIPEAIRTRHVPKEGIDRARHAANVVADLPATAGFLASFIYRRYLSSQRISGFFQRNRAHRYGLSYHAEQSPRAASRVTLTREIDALGLPRLRVDLRFHREDAEATLRAHRLFARWLQTSGLGRVEFRQSDDENLDALIAKMAHGTHQIGTARMGATRHEGVVDGDLRCHDCKNLFVASSAVFPTSGRANPTLSIVAFAVRLAQTLARDDARAAPNVTSAPAA